MTNTNWLRMYCISNKMTAKAIPRQIFLLISNTNYCCKMRECTCNPSTLYTCIRVGVWLTQSAVQLNSILSQAMAQKNNHIPKEYTKSRWMMLFLMNMRLFVGICYCIRSWFTK
ncbi:hypothetical protein GE21DRAFT_1007152 [Neurospora crassa]|nr:hypothetical protein GE21DRAFT_1007152 [Neurospora crassa]